MADRVAPIVRLLIPCDGATLDPHDHWWVITNPWAVAGLPPGSTFPFDVEELSVYVQVTDGVGTFDLAVDIRRVLPDETRVPVGRSQPTRITFAPGDQILFQDWAFVLAGVPFDEPGLYEFVIVTDDVELDGHSAVIRMLDLEESL